MAVQIILLLGVLTLGLLSPGPDFFVVVRNSLGGTRARGLATVAGIITGLGAHTMLIAYGIGALPEAFIRTLSVAGAAFLAWLGIRALVEGATEARRAAPSPVLRRGASSGFMEGLLCNLTNPKAFFFFVGVFAQVIPPDATASKWRLILPLIVIVHGAVLWSLIVLALQSAPVARQLARVQRWLPRCFGIALLFFAALVAIDLMKP